MRPGLLDRHAIVQLLRRSVVLRMTAWLFWYLTGLDIIIAFAAGIRDNQNRDQNE